MKLKDLYEQYELKKNDDVKNNHKEDIYETENYMFYVLLNKNILLN